MLCAVGNARALRRRRKLDTILYFLARFPPDFAESTWCRVAGKRAAKGIGRVDSGAKIPNNNN
ncbi:MAG: hypothetical protein AMXMBFR84_28830 [Candidatus Hydrogenedentota bacterium]